MKTEVIPIRLASAAVRRTMSSRDSSVSGGAGPQSPGSMSAKKPFGLRLASRPISPSRGSGVFSSMRALSIARLSIQNLWPSAFSTITGRVVSSRSRSARVSAVPGGSIASPKMWLAKNRTLVPFSAAWSGPSRQACSLART